MKAQRGNILFLILLAVILFAALSYAVTSSMRGGGKNSGDEAAELAAGQIMQTVAMIRGAMQRAYLVENYGQIFMNADAPTTSGTCYNGQITTTPCKTAGIQNAAFGSIRLMLPKNALIPAARTAMWEWLSIPVLVNGTDVGTSAADETLTLFDVTDAVCQEINKAVNGVDEISLYGSTFGGVGYRSEFFDEAGVSASTSDGAGTRYSLPYESGCFVLGSVNLAFFILRSR